MDATKAHVHGVWRDVKVGTIFAGEASYDPQGKREADQAIRPMAVARLAEAEAFVSYYRLEAVKQGALRAQERYVRQRAKLPGMRWKDGLNAVLAVRAHWLNQTFDSCVLPFA